MILDKLECLIGSVITSAACIALTIAFYEGVGIPSFVPFVGGVSIIDGVVDRRVNTALEGYVLKSEKTAADAKAAEQMRQADAAKAATDKANLAVAAAKASEASLKITREQEIAAYEKRLVDAKRACTTDSDDVDFFMHHQ